MGVSPVVPGPRGRERLVEAGVVFFAAGRPRTKGSTRAFKDRGGNVRTTHANPKTKAWQGVVAHAAHEAGVRPHDEPVGLDLVFRFARPASHYGTGRNAGKLKPSAPVAPATRSVGDLDKLVRAVLDGLEGVAFPDDARVTQIRAEKVWAGAGEAEGVLVNVMVGA